MFRLLTRAAVAAVVALTAVSVDAAGVCYSPFYSSDYTSSKVESLLVRDFQQIAAQGFDSVRTYHAQFYGKNVVNAAKQSGIKVAIGIQMVGTNGGVYEYLENDIQAAIWAAQNVPESVLAIYAGNENLKNGDFGSSSGDSIVAVINRVKNALKGTAGANIPVGTVQRLNEWLYASDASKVAAASDVVGANIYPFFTTGATSDMQGSLDTQWKMFATLYSGKARLTETGWPSQGSSSPNGNTATLENAANYFSAFNAWTQQTPTNSPMYFMMFDVPSATGADYEPHFGIATSSGVMKFQASVASVASASASASNAAGETRSADSTDSTDLGSSTTTVVTETAAPTEEPTPEPTTETLEPTTETPEPTTTTPEPTPEPTTETPEPTRVEVATVQPEPIFDGSETGSSHSGSGSQANHADDIVFPGSNAGSHSTTGEGSDGDAGIAPPTKTTPVSTPAPVASTPAATTLSPEAQAAQAAQAAAEANSKVAREVSGDSGVNITLFASAVSALGVAAVVVIGVYMRRRNNGTDGDETRTVAASSIDPRGSTPSVYDDPLGTRFSSIVMITPNGDGVCIL